MCPGDPRQRNSNASKFEDRSQEGTEWQEWCAREAAWKLAKNILQFKEKHKIAFFSPSKIGACVHQILNPRKEFVVDSGASVHMISEKIWNPQNWTTWWLQKSNDGLNSQWWSAAAWRCHSWCQRMGYFLDSESPRGYASSFAARKALRWTLILMRVDHWSETTSH